MQKTVFIAVVVSLLFATSKWSDAGEIKTPVSDCFLPAWFVEHQGVIGISDPKLDSVTGFNQALNRAIMMYSLSKKTNLSVVYESYYHIENDKVVLDGQMSHWMSEMSSEIGGYKYELLNYCMTKYGETVIEVIVTDDVLCDNSLITNASMYFSFDNRSRYTSYSEKVILETESKNGDGENLLWESTTMNGKNIKNSSIGGECHKIMNETHSYGSGGDMNCDYYVYSDLKYGLWNAYIDLFLQEISKFRSKKTEIKVMGRNISNEYSCKFNDKIQRISRMVYNTYIACNISDIVLIDNILYAKWDIVENNDCEEVIAVSKSYQYDGYGYQRMVQDEKSKSRNESIRLASLHADSELVIMAFSSVKRNMERYNLNAGEIVTDTLSISSRGYSGRIRILRENNTIFKNDAYITTVTKEIVAD